jgi:type I restriction enzyme S subunit
MSSKNKTTPTKDDAKPALAPNLRFPEFRKEDGWHVKKLNELLFAPKKRNRNLELGPTDVLSVSGEHGCVNQIELMGRSYAGVSVKDYHVVEHGDLVYTKSPLKKNPFGIIKENKGKRGIVSTLYAVYRPFADCSGTYLDHFFSGDYNLNSYLQPIVKKGPKNDMKVNNADVLKGDICVPKLLEQKKIADCLSLIDELMAAQARQVDALKNHKKGLMKRLFPQEGESQPRLRFAEFHNTGQWQMNKLGDVASFFKGKGISKADIVVGGRHPCIRYGELYTHYGEVISDIISRTDVADTSLFFSQRNDVIIPASGESKLDIAKASCVMHDDVALGGDLNVIRTSHNGIFLSYYLNGPKRIDIARVAQGDAVVHLYPSQLEKLDVLFPEIREQQRIALCLSSLDTLISLETQKFETLKTHKKGLMQQLFPSAKGLQA